MKFYNNHRGYVACEITPAAMHARYQTVEYVSRDGAPKTTRANFIVEAGKPGAQQQ